MTHPLNRWQTLKTDTKYQNPWMTIREDQVIRPDGKPGIYGVVETKIAVGAVALTPAREVYLVGQYRYPTECYSWEIIEGGAEHGEDPLVAIQRELVEEAGLVARSWTPIGSTIHLSNCISNERALLYLARDLTEGQSAPEGTEVLAVEKKPLSDCVRMVEDGLITDAMSIIAILRLDRLAATGAL